MTVQYITDESLESLSSYIQNRSSAVTNELLVHTLINPKYSICKTRNHNQRLINSIQLKK